MEKTWRPICYGLQWAECRAECERCPFKTSCRNLSKAMRAEKWAQRKEERDV